MRATSSRLVWFAALWLGGVLSVAAVTLVLRFAMSAVGLRE